MEKYGYTGSACITMALDDAIELGKIKRGDLVVMISSGLGYNQAAAAVRMTLWCRCPATSTNQTAKFSDQEALLAAGLQPRAKDDEGGAEQRRHSCEASTKYNAGKFVTAYRDELRQAGYWKLGVWKFHTTVLYH
jgi:3-Oxoacyl-[acyl-carrier-protein (ACP)] synthase III C terminal